MKKEHEFYDYDKEHVDKESQYSKRLTETEELILKPQREENKIASLTEEELKQYMELDIEELKKMKMNSKTILICQATQEFIKENMDSILKIIREQPKKEEGENER